MPLQVVTLREPEVLQRYERKLILVRPDGHVAWRADKLVSDVQGLLDCVRGAALQG
jgi:hypothetical protein